LRSEFTKDKDQYEAEMPLYEKIMCIYAQGGKLFEYVKLHGFQTVSIYGDGKLSDILYCCAFFGKINLQYMISDEVQAKEILLLRQTIEYRTSDKLNDLTENDLIIIAEEQKPIHQILNELRRVTKAKLIHLRNMVEFDYIYISIVLPLLELKQINPGLQVVVFNTPGINLVQNKSEREERIACTFTPGAYNIYKDYDKVRDIVDTAYTSHGLSEEYIKTLYCNQLLDGKRAVNLVNDLRVTTDLPEDPSATIYMFGNSVTRGAGVDDRHTIASSLQRLLNTYYDGHSPYAVMNAASINSGHAYYRTVSDMKSYTYRSHDVIILNYIIGEFLMNELSAFFFCCDFLSLFNRPHDFGEVFVDNVHFNHAGYGKIAESLFKAMLDNGILKSEQGFAGTPEIQKSLESNSVLENDQRQKSSNIKEGKELNDYLVELGKSKIDTAGKAGAIVVNCNPFTLGHRYLIEKSSKEVEHLYVFVVEEDRSFFPFNDRLYLVKKGVSDLSNVTVLGSGKFIISALTFEEYFTKGELTDIVIDPSLDVTIFAEKIAPTLGISVRFVGEEPFCNITRQYNQTMKAIFPKYGLQLVIIPRKTSDGEAISASGVRKLLEEKDFEKIAKIVPTSTLVYLKERFGNTDVIAGSTDAYGEVVEDINTDRSFCTT